MSRYVSGPLPDDVIAEFLNRRRAEDRAAGLPPKVTDPAVLDRIASVVNESSDSRLTGDDEAAA